MFIFIWNNTFLVKEKEALKSDLRADEIISSYQKSKKPKSDTSPIQDQTLFCEAVVK